mmetsp:Transcript_6597/g.22743  ORF Transcript_6597/g.22743 Transcript_6597/m.22743 type:complete len:217 (+) Transcript_6597:987-1637(+)
MSFASSALARTDSDPLPTPSSWFLTRPLSWLLSRPAFWARSSSWATIWGSFSSHPAWNAIVSHSSSAASLAKCVVCTISSSWEGISPTRPPAVLPGLMPPAPAASSGPAFAMAATVCPPSPPSSDTSCDSKDSFKLLYAPACEWSPLPWPVSALFAFSPKAESLSDRFLISCAALCLNLLAPVSLRSTASVVMFQSSAILRVAMRAPSPASPRPAP